MAVEHLSEEQRLCLVLRFRMCQEEHVAHRHRFVLAPVVLRQLVLVEVAERLCQSLEQLVAHLAEMLRVHAPLVAHQQFGHLVGALDGAAYGAAHERVALVLHREFHEQEQGNAAKVHLPAWKNRKWLAISSQIPTNSIIKKIDFHFVRRPLVL